MNNGYVVKFSSHSLAIEVLQIFEEGANAYYNGMSKYKRTVKATLPAAIDWT